jgi:hypothetical protein
MDGDLADQLCPDPRNLDAPDDALGILEPRNHDYRRVPELGVTADVLQHW